MLPSLRVKHHSPTASIYSHGTSQPYPYCAYLNNPPQAPYNQPYPLECGKQSPVSYALSLRQPSSYLASLQVYDIYLSSKYSLSSTLLRRIEPIQPLSICLHAWSLRFFLPALSLFPGLIPAHEDICASVDRKSVV